MRSQIFLFAILVSSQVYASKLPHIELRPKVKQEIDRVLENCNQLHIALVSKDEKAIKKSLGQLRAQLDTAVEATKTKVRMSGYRTIAAEMPPQEKNLNHMLLEIQRQVSRAEQTKKKDRVPHLQEAYKQLVLMTRTYGIKTSYKVFFCDKDRSTWLQKSNKAQNPFLSEGRNCGKMIVK